MGGKRATVPLVGLLSLWLLGFVPAGAYVIERVSVASDCSQGNDESGRSGVSISADGRYVAFHSSASNLVAGDTNGCEDIFVHDRQTGQTTRVSVASDGSEGNYHSNSPSLSADGRYVAFASGASNLVAGDTNNTYDIFVRDRSASETFRVSVAWAGNPSANSNGSSNNPSLSADGRYVAFWSGASNLVAGDTNGDYDIFMHDRQTGQTMRVSIASDGSQGNGGSNSSSLSADGRYVAFWSWASNLVAGDTNGIYDVFMHDCLTGQTTRVSVAGDGSEGNWGSVCPSLNADGRHVAFSSGASNLVPGDTNGNDDVFVHDCITGQTTRVSVAGDGSQGDGYSGTYALSLSADGRSVPFQSLSSNLVAGDTNGKPDVFVAINPLSPSSMRLPTRGWYLVSAPHEGDHPLATLEVARPSANRTMSFCDAVAAGWINPTLYAFDHDRFAYSTCSCDGPPIDDDNTLRQGQGYWLCTNVAGLTLVFP